MFIRLSKILCNNSVAICKSVNFIYVSKDRKMKEEKEDLESRRHCEYRESMLYVMRAPSFPRAREYVVRIIASEHLSYKIAVDTCQGNIKL